MNKPEEQNKEVVQYNSDKFRKRLGEAIKRANLTQAKLAEKVGVSQQTISGYVNTGKMPALDTVVSIANALGVSLDWLLDMPERKCEHEGASSFSVGDLYRAVEQVEIIGNTEREMVVVPDPNPYKDGGQPAVQITIYNGPYCELLSKLIEIEGLRKKKIIDADMYEYITTPILEKADQTPLYDYDYDLPF